MNRLVQFIENLLKKDTLNWTFTQYWKIPLIPPRGDNILENTLDPSQGDNIPEKLRHDAAK